MRSRVACNFKPNAGQQRFLSSSKRFRLALTGVGGGKSAVGAVEALCLAHENGCVPGMIISPTYDMLRLNTVPPIKEWWPDGLITNPKAMDRQVGPFQVKLWNGAPVYFRSGNDPDQLRGPNLGWAWLDEAGQMPRYVWDVVLGRLRVQCARPGAILTTTPCGYTWLYDYFHASPPSDEYEMITWTALENKGNLAPGFYEEMLRSLSPLMAEQEVHGKFVNVHAEAFLKAESVVSSERDYLPRMPTDSLPLFLGVDIGRKHDLTVITGLWQQGDTYYVGILKRMFNRPFYEQLVAINSLLPRCVQCAIDETGIGCNLAETLYNEHGSMIIPVTFGPKSKTEMASRMRKMFEQGQLRIPKDEKLRRALLSVESAYTAQGQVSLHASRSEDGHADEFWSLALACHAVGRQPSEILLAVV